METQLNNETTTSSPTSQPWPLRRVGLRVLDLDSEVEYYTRFGLSIVRDERSNGPEGGVGLGFGTQEVLSLRPLINGRPRPRRSAGLYHFALLLPDEAALGSFLQHCIEQNIPIDGASDHLVSQALYLSDVEGNGIEVYADRPRETWQFSGNTIVMDTLPLNAAALLRKAHPFEGFPADSRLGHMHLNVGNLDRSRAFYEKLGMNLMVGLANSANFLSWEGYHHHLGINVWAGRNVPPVEPDVAGIDFYEIQRPDLEPVTLTDPDGIKVIVSGR